MCLTCVEAEMVDAGIERLEVTDRMRVVGGLIRQFYELHHCGVGGPLHIVTDDNNVTDDNLAFCRNQLFTGTDGDGVRWGFDVRSLGLAILNAFDDMTEAERSLTCMLNMPEPRIAALWLRGDGLGIEHDGATATP